MATPTFRAMTSDGLDDNTSPTISAPAGLSDGDLILVAIATSSTTDVANVPDGWSQVGSTQDSGGTDSSLMVFQKIASSEGASWTFTNLMTTARWGAYGCVAYYNVDGSVPLDGVAPVTSAGSYGGTHTTGSITPTTDGAMVVALFGAEPDSSSQAGTPDSSPAATERVDECNGTTGFVYIEDYVQATAASINLSVGLSTADTTAEMILALRPGDPAGSALPGPAGSAIFNSPVFGGVLVS